MVIYWTIIGPISCTFSPLCRSSATTPGTIPPNNLAVPVYRTLGERGPSPSGSFNYHVGCG